jgi:hypothetical protein
MNNICRFSKSFEFVPNKGNQYIAKHAVIDQIRILIMHKTRMIDDVDDDKTVFRIQDGWMLMN